MPDDSPHARRTTGSSPQIVVVELPAEIDVRNDEQVYDALALALYGGAAVLVADASGTTFCGCAGARALIRAHHLAAAAGTQLRIAASPPVQRILELTHTDHLLSTYSTLSAARSGPMPPQDRPDSGEGQPARRIRARQVIMAGLLTRVTRHRHQITGRTAS
jgi:anti-sigma B factor antagonist